MLSGKINGRCPTEICGAACCQKDPWTGESPCQMLTEDLRCKLEMGEHGKLYKPYWCALWPQDQGQIDRFNADPNLNNCELSYIEVLNVG